MLMIHATASAGSSILDMMHEMLALAQKTGAGIEVKGNGCTFWVYPDDTPAEITAAYERLYDGREPASRLISTSIRKRIPELPGAKET